MVRMSKKLINKNYEISDSLVKGSLMLDPPYSETFSRQTECLIRMTILGILSQICEIYSSSFS